MTPTRKVGAGALAGALTVIGIWATQEFAQVEIPAEVASAITVVLTLVTSWFVTDGPAQQQPPKEESA